TRRGLIGTSISPFLTNLGRQGDWWPVPGLAKGAPPERRADTPKCNRPRYSWKCETHTLMSQLTAKPLSSTKLPESLQDTGQPPPRLNATSCARTPPGVA